MKFYRDKFNNIIVPTGLEIEPGLVFRDVRKVWKRSTKAESRLELLKNLGAKNLGLPTLENSIQHEANMRHSFKYKSKMKRNPDLIRSQMDIKIKDAYQAVRETNSEKFKLRKILEKALGKSPDLKSKVFDQLNRETRNLREALKKKNREKVLNLEEKYLKPKLNESCQVPEEIQRFEKIKLYTTDLQKEKRDIRVNIEVIGDVQVDDEELSVLRLPPEFAVLDKLRDEDFMHETEMAMTKIRWEKMKDLEEEDDVVDEEEEAKKRQIFDPLEKVIDMRKRRVTDMKENSRVILPKPLTAHEEAKIAVRREHFEEVFSEYCQEHCSEKGEQKSNLTFSQRNGLRKLKKRIKDGEIVVMLTDKSGKLAVSDVESYMEMGAVHTSKDTEVGDETVRKIQRLYNGHTSMWLKMANVGENWDHEDRLRESCLQNTNNVPPMYLLAKDHKIREPGQLPATRPVVSGCSGMQLSLSNLLSDHLESLANSRQNPIEVISTEDMLSRINSYNENVSEANQNIEKVLVGADCIQLFPSLKAAQSGRIVREAAAKIISQSGLEIRGLDYQEIAKYVRMNMSDFEIQARKLNKIIPVRKFNRGSMPGMSGEEATRGYIPEDEERFIHSLREPTDVEKVNLYATALECSIRFIFSKNLYRFANTTYLQSDSGPIGLRVTMCVARLVMGEWADKLREILDKSGIERHLEALYVDDIRFVLSSLPLGWRWSQEDKQFIFKEEWKKDDIISNDSSTRRTSREICKAMNSIYSNLQFTVEIEEDFENSRLPTLDCQIFMDKSTYQIEYSFFEKSMKTPFCVMKNSAMSEKSKISILSQDLIRRMQNTGQTISESERISIIDNYIDRLLVSGYNVEQIREIVESGLKGYLRKLNRAIKSGIPLHRPAATTLQSRIKKKLTEKSSWYKKKPENIGDSKKVSRKIVEKKSIEKSTKVISVMFVQKTPGSLLANKLKEADRKLSEITEDRVRITERAGLKLRSILHKSDPWAGQKCSDLKCLICTNPNNKTFGCSRRNVVYKSVCLTCKADSDKNDANKDTSENKDDFEKADDERAYFGESHVSGRERSIQHSRDFLNKKDDSHQYKHYTEAHAELDMKDVKFGVTILRQFFSSFSRQHFEAILIFKNSNNLNSKSMYNRSKIPRLNVMFNELEENKKVYDEAELDEEIVKLKGNHIREPGLEDPPPPPCKKQKRWHALKMKKKRKKLNENLEKESKIIETEEVEVSPVFEKVSEDIEKLEVVDKDKQEIKMFPIFDSNVFVFEAKNVKSVKPKQKYSKRGLKKSNNPILNYFTTERGSTSLKTSFPAD